jgi:hypothetical protein
MSGRIRAVLRRDGDLTAIELEAIATTLAAMDRRTPEGPWTAKAMELIDQFPGRPAEVLAREVGQDKVPES